MNFDPTDEQRRWRDLARDFAVFYEKCKVIDSDNEAFRLALCAATQRVIARSLDLLGVEAPDAM